MTLKYFSRTDTYKNSTGTNRVNLIDHTAYSYDWWLYYTKYKGRTVFNHTTYSSSTSKHQRDALNILNSPPTFVLYNTRLSLTNPEEAIKDEVNNIRAIVKELIAKVKAPRTKLSTNNARRIAINEHLQTIKQYRVLLAS